MNFKPMLCQPTTIEEVEKGTFETGEWFAERKYDGVRVYMKDRKIFSRSGQDVTYKFPELIEVAKRLCGVVDGEIVASTNNFEDVVGRMHLKDKLFIRIASKSNPVNFIAFDHVDLDETKYNILQKSRKARLGIILALVREYDLVKSPRTHDSPKALLEDARKEGWEGIIIKRKLAKYDFGTRSYAWRKVKLFKEVHHTFTKYENHSRGILLIDGDFKVNVNGLSAKEVVEHMSKNGGKVVVEVQYMEHNDSHKWRFPSFRGIVKEESK